MDAFTVFLIVFFTIAAGIPAVLSIIGLIRGDWWYLPGVGGIVVALAFLSVTFYGIHTKWGGCPPGSKSDEGAVSCYKKLGDKDPVCQPDIWKLECPGPRPTCGTTAIPPRAFCPSGQVVIFPFCERIESVVPGQPNGVKQPWATWSDLSFIAAGLWLLWYFHYFKPSGTASAAGFSSDNPMRMIGALSLIYAVIVIFMGPASQWFHASMKRWGGWFDTMSVVLWLGFNAVYVSYALFRTTWGKGRGTERTFIVLGFWICLIFFCAILAGNELGLVAYFITGGLWGLAEIFYLIWSFKCNVKFSRRWWWFAINLAILIVTMTIWGFFNPSLADTGCDGRAWFPGHAVFHILASFSTIVTFISFASERAVTRIDWPCWGDKT